jgi:hypothetical protein
MIKIDIHDKVKIILDDEDSDLENFRDMFVKEGNVNVSPQRIRVFEVKL